MVELGNQCERNRQSELRLQSLQGQIRKDHLLKKHRNVHKLQSRRKEDHKKQQQESAELSLRHCY